MDLVNGGFFVCCCIFKLWRVKEIYYYIGKKVCYFDFEVKIIKIMYFVNY